MSAGVAASWLHPLLVAMQGKRTARRRTADCTGAVRAVLASGEWFRLAELYEALGRRWARPEIGSVLKKLEARGVLDIGEKIAGCRGRRYKTMDGAERVGAADYAVVASEAH